MINLIVSLAGGSVEISTVQQTDQVHACFGRRNLSEIVCKQGKACGKRCCQGKRKRVEKKEMANKDSSQKEQDASAQKIKVQPRYCLAVHIRVRIRSRCRATTPRWFLTQL